MISDRTHQSINKFVSELSVILNYWFIIAHCLCVIGSNWSGPRCHVWVQETPGNKRFKGSCWEQVWRHTGRRKAWEQRCLLPTKFLRSVERPHAPCFCSLVCYTLVNMFSLQNPIIFTQSCVPAMCQPTEMSAWQSITWGRCLFACMYEWCHLFVFGVNYSRYWDILNVATNQI